MGAIEEGGKVATGVVDSLKSQPLAIALIVINILFLAGVGYLLTDLAKKQAVMSERKDALLAEMVRKAFECSMPRPQN